jgi:hypothetical protein
MWSTFNGRCSKELDKAITAINELQTDFEENDSEIETVARESIGETIHQILKYLKST